MLSEADRVYVRAGYFTLEELCAGRAEAPAQVERMITDGLLPAASYVLDGTGMFPADYFVLVDQAGGVETVRSAFEERYRAIGGDPANVGEDWDGYLSGLFGVCLRHVTPETIVRKEQLATSLQALLAQPEPDRAEWQATLRRQVTELDALERPFSPDFDRNGRFPEPPSRDRLIGAAHQRYPQLFG